MSERLPDDLRERLDRVEASFDWKQGFAAGWLAREMESKEDSIICPQCGRTSHNPNDVRERYCGACHQYHDTMGVEKLNAYQQDPLSSKERGDFY